MRFPSRKVPVFEPMRIAKGTRCPYALESNTIPFHASASNAPTWTSENSCDTCAASDSGKSRARKIAGCSHRAPRRRTRCLCPRPPVSSWLIARVCARGRLPVDFLASFICGPAHFEAVANSGSMEVPVKRTTGPRLMESRAASCRGFWSWLDYGRFPRIRPTLCLPAHRLQIVPAGIKRYPCDRNRPFEFRARTDSNRRPPGSKPGALSN